MRQVNQTSRANPPDATETEGFTFHAGLNDLYRIQLERLRLTFWSEDAFVRLYMVGPGGLEQKIELERGWFAWRVTGPQVDTDFWKLEIEEAAEVTAELIARVAAVDLIGHGLPVRCKVSQLNKPVVVGHVWRLELIPTGEAVPIPVQIK